MGHDEVTGNQFVAYGWDVVTAISASEIGRPVKVVRMSILQATLELEALLAATSVAKGRHEYIAFGGQN